MPPEARPYSPSVTSSADQKLSLRAHLRISEGCFDRRRVSELFLAFQNAVERDADLAALHLPHFRILIVRTWDSQGGRLLDRWHTSVPHDLHAALQPSVAPPTIAKFAQSDALVRCLVGPVGSGKTMGTIMELLRRTVDQAPFEGVRRTRFVCVRNTLQQLRSTVLSDIQTYIHPIVSYFTTENAVLFQEDPAEAVRLFQLSAEHGLPLYSWARERVVEAVLQEGWSRNQAAARFGIGSSTAINWVRRFQETGSVAAGQMGGHKPKAIRGEYEVFVRRRLGEGNFTLRGLVAELTDRGLKVDYRSVWNFVHAEKLSHKKRR